MLWELPRRAAQMEEELTVDGRIGAHSRNKPRVVIPGRSNGVCTSWGGGVLRTSVV